MVEFIKTMPVSIPNCQNLKLTRLTPYSSACQGEFMEVMDSMPELKEIVLEDCDFTHLSLKPWLEELIKSRVSIDAGGSRINPDEFPFFYLSAWLKDPTITFPLEHLAKKSLMKKLFPDSNSLLKILWHSFGMLNSCGLDDYDTIYKFADSLSVSEPDFDVVSILVDFVFAQFVRNPKENTFKNYLLQVRNLYPFDFHKIKENMLSLFNLVENRSASSSSDSSILSFVQKAMTVAVNTSLRFLPESESALYKNLYLKLFHKAASINWDDVEAKREYYQLMIDQFRVLSEVSGATSISEEIILRLSQVFCSAIHDKPFVCEPVFTEEEVRMYNHKLLHHLVHDFLWFDNPPCRTVIFKSDHQQSEIKVTFNQPVFRYSDLYNNRKNITVEELLKLVIDLYGNFSKKDKILNQDYVKNIIEHIVKQCVIAAIEQYKSLPDTVGINWDRSNSLLLELKPGDGDLKEILKTYADKSYILSPSHKKFIKALYEYFTTMLQGYIEQLDIPQAPVKQIVTNSTHADTVSMLETASNSAPFSSSSSAYRVHETKTASIDYQDVIELDDLPSSSACFAQPAKIPSSHFHKACDDKEKYKTDTQAKSESSIPQKNHSN